MNGVGGLIGVLVWCTDLVCLSEFGLAIRFGGADWLISGGGGGLGLCCFKCGGGNETYFHRDWLVLIEQLGSMMLQMVTVGFGVQCNFFTFLVENQYVCRDWLVLIENRTWRCGYDMVR